MIDDTKSIDDFELIELMSFKPSDCFYGDLRVEFVQDRLTKAGEFLLRYSPLGDTFIVSLKTKNQMRHFPCIQQKQGDNPRFTFNTEYSSSSFDGLVQFHYINRIPLEKGNPETLLLSPVLVPEYRFDENDIEIIRKVGAGAYGDVFKVKVKSANVFLAMKTLKGDVSDAEKENFLK
uniref:SH2 domain-containing protein n=1 Tax=Romanomermis culicivorax TaxID=13658 RepID=A0A915JP21_ROMCU